MFNEQISVSEFGRAIINCFQNLLCRACLKGSIESMWNIIDTSLEQQYIKDVLNIDALTIWTTID